jgi:tetratricopeptide (TPR) repeat protein
VAVIALHRYRHSFSSLISAKHRFKRSMARATTPQEVAHGLEQFLQRRYRLPASRTPQDQTVGSLRAFGHGEIAIEVERLYHECDRDTDSKSTVRYTKTAQELVNTLCESNGRRGSQHRLHQSNAPYLNTKSALTLLALLISPAATSTSLAIDSLPAQPTVEDMESTENAAEEAPIPAEPSRFSEDQIKNMVDEASVMYLTGMRSQEQSERMASFAEAAERLQFLVDSGITNDELFATLASAQVRSGNTAKAVANYRRALRYAPENQAYHDRLSEAETAQGLVLTVPSSQLDRARTLNDFVLHFCSPTGMLVLALLAWACAWALIAWRLISGPQPWKLPMACFILLALTAFASYQLRVSEFLLDNQAVVTQADVSLLEGDGNEFGILLETPFLGGDLVEVLDQRGSWHKVRLPDGQSGWLPSTALQII